MIAETTLSEPDAGLRILARIIARDWAKRYLEVPPVPPHKDATGVERTAAIAIVGGVET